MADPRRPATGHGPRASARPRVPPARRPGGRPPAGGARAARAGRLRDAGDPRRARRRGHAVGVAATAGVMTRLAELPLASARTGAPGLSVVIATRDRPD